MAASFLIPATFESVHMGAGMLPVARRKMAMAFGRISSATT